MVRLNVVLLFAALLAIAACGADSSPGEGESISTTAALGASTTVADDPDSVDQATDGNSEARTIELDVADAPIYDNGSGVTLTIDDARVGDLTSLPEDVAEEMAFGLDDPNSQAFLILTITVENRGDAPVGFFPDQGTALVGSQQVEANFFFSESFTGGSGTILDGASISKDVYFELPQSADEVAGLRQARYTVSGPFDDETFESLGPDVDLTVAWSQ